MIILLLLKVYLIVGFLALTLVFHSYLNIETRRKVFHFFQHRHMMHVPLDRLRFNCQILKSRVQKHMKNTIFLGGKNL